MTKTISATKKMLAMILAVLMMFSGMAVSASAETDPGTVPTTTTPTAPAKPTLVLNEADKKVTITPPAGAEISISPRPSDPIKADGKVIFINLVPGTKYTVKAYVTDTVNLTNVYSDPVEFILKSQQQPPLPPVLKAVTSKSITIAEDTNCEYRVIELDAAGQQILPAKVDWQDQLVHFDKLTADTRYYVSVRRKGTDDRYPSEPVSITVKTLLKADSKAADKPVLVDKTNKTITVAEVPGVQFSIDNGATWQTSGTFTGLSANKIYGVVARKIFDKAVQDPNPVSAILEVKTNTRERYAAVPGNCKFTVAEGTIYAEKGIQVTVIGDGPAGSFNNLRLGEYGDTQLVPSRVHIGNRSFELTRVKDNVYTGTITPEASLANTKKVEVRVEYIVRRHNGESFVNAGKTDISKHTIDVGAKWGVFTIIAEAFAKVANFFLNTLPQLITDVFGSETAKKLFDEIMKFIESLGKPQK